MMGLTEEEVLKRFGKPTSILPEGDDDWSYQIGMDPGAIVSFKDGRVADVSVWKKQN